LGTNGRWQKVIWMVAMANENALWRWLGVLSVGWCRGAIKSLCHPDGSVTFWAIAPLRVVRINFRLIASSGHVMHSEVVPRGGGIVL
jgi:hypothetical protein